MTSETAPVGHLDLRCSIQSKALGDHAAGLAGSSDQYVLVELPLPWPSHIEEHRLLADLGAAPPGAPRSRILGVTRDIAIDTSAPDRMRLVVYRRRATDGDMIDGFEPFVGEVSPEQLTERLGPILAGDLAGLDPGSADRVDVLVCGHGSRDRCCGQMGTLLHAELALTIDPDGPIHCWRTSHTGGHRYAPTVLPFPSGSAWADLDAATVLGLLDQSVPPTTARRHLRGRMGASDPMVQAADGDVLGSVGWSWWGQPVTATVEAFADGRADVELTGGGATYRVLVDRADPVPVPVCGEPLSAAKKSAAQFVRSGAVRTG